MNDERAKLNRLSNTALVAYWNILNAPVMTIDDEGKVERHTAILDNLLSERGIAHERGKRTTRAA